MVLTSWFLAVNVVIAVGMWQADPYSVGLQVFGSVVLLTMLARMRPLRYAANAIGTDSLIYVHALRVWGLLLLPFSGEGVVAAWAFPVACSEISLAALALPLGLFAGNFPSRAHVSLVWTWCTVGLASAVISPFAAIWHSALDNDAMQALSAYPLALLPCFFMPLAITAHLLLLGRLMQWKSPELEEANDLSS